MISRLYEEIAISSSLGLGQINKPAPGLLIDFL
jgi:hypothetical protein